MLTNSFHSDKNLIGFNIERLSDGSFAICVATKKDNQWRAQTLSGVFGDIDDKILIKQVVERGSSLDKETATNIFSNLTAGYGDYIII